jgi:invasion protein IalB
LSDRAPPRRAELLGQDLLAAEGRLLVAAVLVATALAGAALAEAEVTRTVGKWIVACEQTEAGGRACELRNDEGAKPALEQSKLLSFTLHDGSNEAEGLVRIADLEFPPRLDVEIGFGDRKLAVEGVGRHNRLAARFTLPTSELQSLAGADAIRVRFIDQQAQARELVFPTAGLAKALALANDHL